MHLYFEIATMATVKLRKIFRVNIFQSKTGKKLVFPGCKDHFRIDLWHHNKYSGTHKTLHSPTQVNFTYQLNGSMYKCWRSAFSVNQKEFSDYISHHCIMWKIRTYMWRILLGIFFRFGTFQEFPHGNQKIMDLTGSKHSAGICQFSCNPWGKSTHLWSLFLLPISWVLGCWSPFSSQLLTA